MATISFSGAFDKPVRWAHLCEQAPDLRRKVLLNLAEEALDLVKTGFEKESDPYGRSWKPLRVRRGRILQDSGRLRASFHRKTISDVRFTIAAAVKYAGFHQSGTSRMVARAMLPVGGRLPGTWSRSFTDIAEQVLADHFT